MSEKYGGITIKQNIKDIIFNIKINETYFNSPLQ